MCLGIPGQVVSVGEELVPMGLVNVSGVKRRVNLACVVDEDHPLESLVGEWVLVHVGFAMSRIDPEEANRTLALLAELGEIQAELDAMKESGVA